MNLDVSGGCWSAKLIGNGEGNCSVPLVDLEVFRCLEQHVLPLLACRSCGVVAGWTRCIDSGLFSISRLTSSSSSSYLHPLGRVGQWYGVGIFVILLDGRGRLIDQHDGVFTCEAKSCQVGRERGNSSMPRDWSSCGAEDG